MTESHQSKPDIRNANVCPPCPKDADIIDRLVYWLGIGLGSGLPKRAPGTWGTVGGLLVALPLMMLGFVPFLVLTLVASVVGIWICGRASELMNVHDDPHIVWDEWAGIWITLLPLSYYDISVSSLWATHTDKLLVSTLLVAAFVLFRFFDIIKPPPIGWADRQVSGGLGIMLDDIIAGGMSLVILLILLATPLFTTY